jgi:hypothetical protein
VAAIADQSTSELRANLLAPAVHADAFPTADGQRLPWGPAAKTPGTYQTRCPVS